MRSGKRLMIVSASTRLKESATEATPALMAYDGIFARVLRRYIREGNVEERDVLFVSPLLGLLRGIEPLPRHESSKKDWHNPKVDRNQQEILNQKALNLLKDIAKSGKYSEVYINVGKELHSIIEGIEGVLSCRIVYAEGSGIGPKAAHMKKWMLQG